MRYDLAGQRFGRLVAIEPTDRRASGSVVWRCRCDCGRECEVSGAELRRGRSRSCGCMRGPAPGASGGVEPGQRFGKLVAVERTGESRDGGGAVWRCRCDCGRECEATRADLVARGKRDCGCTWRGGPSDASFVDLAGQRFGKLVAVRPVDGEGSYKMWECACDCGNSKVVSSAALKRGNVKSCGCLRGSGGGDGRALELEGRRFGRLVVTGRAPGKGGRAMWECACDCGNTTVASSSALVRGTKRSCGCLKKEHVAARDISGRRFGELVAVRPAGRLEGGHPVWVCECGCGRELEASVRDLELGRVTSCGRCGGSPGAHGPAAVRERRARGGGRDEE